MDIKPIKSQADYDAAVAEIGRLMDAPPGSADEDRLDVLATLVAAYDAEHYAFSAPDPISAIESQMEQMGLTLEEVAPLFGGLQEARDVLAGRRALTLPMIRALHDRLRIPADVLIQPTPAAAAE
jgi:HTH-type transcriptional regulator / antitoxin HigA